MRNKYKTMEDFEQKTKRLEVLAKIKEMVNNWQKECAVKDKKIHRDEAEKKPASVLTFGSYELQAHFPDTDMDLICVFPSYITNDDFFIKFKSQLSQIEDIRYVIDVVDARVPVLKFQYKE